MNENQIPHGCQVVNVTPRYAKLRDSANKVFGYVCIIHPAWWPCVMCYATEPIPCRWQNFELSSDRPFETMLAEMKR
jgi:dihydropyrimidine dehydrogenase (NADP+)